MARTGDSPWHTNRSLHLRAFVAAGLTLATLVLAPSEARAQGIEWTRGAGAEGCIETAELSRSLREVGSSPVRTEGLRLRGRVSRVDAAYVIQVSVLDDAGRSLAAREVRASVPNCRSLDDAIVVVATLLLDAEAARRRGVERRDAVARGPRLGLSAGLGAGTGPLPAPTLRAELGLVWTRARLSLGANFAFERGETKPALEGELRSYALWGEVFGCGRAAGSEGAGLGLCGTLRAGRLLMRTRGLLSENGSVRLTHARVGLGMRFALELGRRARLFSMLIADIALGRPGVSVRSMGDEIHVYRAPLLSARLSVGLSFRVP